MNTFTGDSFSNGLARALVRKAKEKQAKQNTGHAQNVDMSDANAIIATKQPVKPTSEQYQTTLLAKMRSRLAQLKEESK